MKIGKFKGVAFLHLFQLTVRKPVWHIFYLGLG